MEDLGEQGRRAGAVATSTVRTFAVGMAAINGSRVAKADRMALEGTL